jgi:exopolysaccharide biosynthesis polyprenyl glycosylphosphotransferase
MWITRLYQWLPSGAAIVALLLARLTVIILRPAKTPVIFSLSDAAVLGLIALVGAWGVARWYTYYRKTCLPRSRQKYITDALKEAILLTLILTCAVVLWEVRAADRWFMGFFSGWYAVLMILAKRFQKNYSSRTEANGLRYVLILGSKLRALDIIDVIERDSAGDYQIIGALDIETDRVGQTLRPGVEVIGTLNDLEDILRHHVVDELIFTIPLRLITNAQDLFDLAEKVGATVRIVPDWQVYSLAYEPQIASMAIESFKGIPTMTLVTQKGQFYASLIKELIDHIGAVILICLLSPLMIFIVLSIKLVNRGPAVFRQKRLGLHGRQFNVFKFRTMVHDAEQMQAELVSQNESDGPVFKIKHDPRIIPVIGTALRRSGLDELPQLFNILKGQMSLVGPRPPIPGEVWRYDVPQLRRLSVKPGITGLWQCTPKRNSIPFAEWVALDLQYIDQWSLRLDLKILIKTIYIFFRFDGQ